MGDLIRRQDAITAHCELCSDKGKCNDICPDVEVFQLIPAQPEIVRCKDCKHYEWMDNRIPEEQTWHCCCWNADTGKDDFCSYAERRTDE